MMMQNEKEFMRFFFKVFRTLMPGENLVKNWHIEYLCSYVCSNANKRMLINMPPRSLKSMLLSVAWPAWILGHKPSNKIIVASYSRLLSAKHSEDTRAIMQSQWYQKMFARTILDQTSNTKYKFKTSAHGFRMATSIMGTLTGEGADILIADDPQAPIYMNSKILRQKAKDWFDQTFCTRLNNRKHGVIAVITQRLHEDDLSAHVIKKQSFDHISIPIISREEEVYSTANFSYKRKANEGLCQELDSPESIQSLQNEIGGYAFMAQYMQQPYSNMNAVLKLKWLRYFSQMPCEGLIFQSWDVASSQAIASDYSVCMTFKVFDGQIYILDVMRKKMEYTELKAAAIQSYKLYMPCYMLIENKSSGIALIQELQEQILPIKAVTPKLDKMTRVLRVLGIIEAGKLHLDGNAKWLAEFEYEYSHFPNARHDDQIDALSQFLGWYIEHFNHTPKIRMF